MTDVSGQEVSPRRPTHAESARTLQAAARRGVLATSERDSGYPYASIVEVCPADDGDFVVLLSDLAEHTANFREDDRVSLVLAETFDEERILALGRATYVGRIEEAESKDRYRDAYLDLHPDAAGYVDFGDFSFYRIRVERVRFIGGFGRMGWVKSPAYHEASADPLVDSMEMILEHMNEDHAHNLVDYARAFTDAVDAKNATMVRLDQYGFDMRVEVEDGEREVRVGFEKPLTTSDDVHAEMVRLARTAREELA